MSTSLADPADEAAFWRAVFDSKRPTPPSEDRAGMLSMAAFSKGTGAFELRAMPLYLADVRIVYGTPRVDVFDADPRSTQVGQILREKLNQRFVWQVPEFVNNKGEAHQVMRIGHDIRNQRQQRRQLPAFSVSVIPANGTRSVANDRQNAPIVAW